MHWVYSIISAFLMGSYCMIHYGNEISNDAIQWKQIQSLLSLNTSEISLIKKTIGTVDLDTLSKFIAALERLVVQKVCDHEINPQDALLIDRDNHELLVDNDYIRVLWIKLAAGEACIPHTHQWPSITLIVSGLKFLSHKSDGNIVEEEWLPGVYEVPGDTNLEAFTNTSQCDYRALAVELKCTLPTHIP